MRCTGKNPLFDILLQELLQLFHITGLMEYYEVMIKFSEVTAMLKIPELAVLRTHYMLAE